MEKWLCVSLQVVLALFVTHLLGYLIPTLQFIYFSFYVTWKLFLYVFAAAIALWISFKPTPYVIKTYRQDVDETIVAMTKERLAVLKLVPGKIKRSPIVSRNVDDVIDELMSLLMKDYIDSWYTPLVKEPSLFCQQLKEAIREILFIFQDRCRIIDDVELFTNDFVLIITDHMKRLRCSVINPSEKIQAFKVYRFLEDKNTELDYIRVLVEFFLTTLLPPEYVCNEQLICLLREIFSVKVFYPVVTNLCDPDFINTKLIAYLEQQEVKAKNLSRTYEYAETYEDFVKLIQECSDVEELQRMRYYCATEIMHATTISHLKRLKGMGADVEFIPLKTNKGELLESRNLPRYLNQLHFARSLIEKRIKMYGGLAYASSSKASNDNRNKSSSSSAMMPGQKVLSLSVIMQSSFCRRYFSKFLQKEGAHSLLGFWEGVEEMEHSSKEHWHKQGNDIIQIYVQNPSSSVRLSQNTLKGIEEFIIGNKGREAFFHAQKEVYRVLENQHYSSFIVSDVYHRMLADVEKEGINFMEELPVEFGEEIETSVEEFEEVNLPETTDVSAFDHSGYARSQLSILKDKLSYKKQALEALKNNPKCEKKVMTMLSTEIGNLVKEQNMLENHIEKTELWIEYLGFWQATIMEAMEKKENEKILPYFVIRVHLASDAEFTPNTMSGWVVSRNLNSFHSLHQKLVPAASWLKKIDLPTKPIFKTFDRNYLEKAKNALQTFLSAVTKDDGLNKSEALYDFLSPSPEYMKHPPAPPKKPWKSNILQFFKGVQNTLIQLDEPEDEVLLFLDDMDSKDDKNDSLAEPLYTLIGEIFELKGVFSWLRKSLIMFVQVAFGRSINRQLTERVSFTLSEPMLLFYLQLFRDTMWPPLQESESGVERNTEQKRLSKLEAKQMLCENTPQTLIKLLGQQNAKKGLSKMFDALQNPNCNKHLVYKLIEAFIYKYAPELQKITSLCKIEEKNNRE